MALKFARPRLWAKGATVWVVACLGATNACAVPAVPAVPAAPAAPTLPASQSPVASIVLDSGHSPLRPGALGARGLHEVSYNDRVTSRVALALRVAGFNVVLTRTPLQEISLEGRSDVANSASADLFLAIHHDSTQLKYLEKFKVGKLDAYRTTSVISGYSVFVSQSNPQYAQSLRFAKLLAGGIHALGRQPALHHAELVAGESRELLDAKLGIYRFDQLSVLRKASIPAVLLEVGVIPDQKDEAYVSDEGNQAKITAAIVTAVQRYAGSPQKTDFKVRCDLNSEGTPYRGKPSKQSCHLPPFEPATDNATYQKVVL